MAKVVKFFLWPTLDGVRAGPRLGPFDDFVVIDRFVIQTGGGRTIAEPQRLEGPDGKLLPPEEGFRFQVGDESLVDFEGADPDDAWGFRLYDGVDCKVFVAEQESPS